jgi:hypothetical protein
MRELLVAVVFSAIFFVAGLGIIRIAGVETKETSALVAGVLWGIMIPLMTWGLKDKKQLGVKLAKLARIYDPLYGTPAFVNGKIRYYNNRSDSPRFDSLLSMNELTTIDILSISSYVITLVYIDGIKKALDRGVKFNFLILNPTSKNNLKTQANNYPAGKNLQRQINDSLSALREARNELPDDKKENLVIRMYDDIIPKGVLIAHLDNHEDKVWMKIENYIVRSDPNSRSAVAFYKSHDPTVMHDFNYYSGVYGTFVDRSTPYECKKAEAT